MHSLSLIQLFFIAHLIINGELKSHLTKANQTANEVGVMIQHKFLEQLYFGFGKTAHAESQFFEKHVA